MAAIDHWNPVALSSELGKKPLAVKVDGREIVLFRTESGLAGALDDVCVHRRMRLSCGSVCGEELVCPYHGWRFRTDGNAESPGTPKMRAQAPNFDVREEQGIVWLKPAGCEAVFPEFNNDGYFHMATSRHDVNVPLELAVDNFSEVEHTPMTHLAFGYDISRMSEVKLTVEADDRAIHCRTEGPHQPMPWWLRGFFGVGKHVDFTSDWMTYFSPVHLVIDHVLLNHDTGQKAMVLYRAYVLFNPIDAENTTIFSVLYAQSRYAEWRFSMKSGGLNIFRPLIRRHAIAEVELDCVKLRDLADKRPNLDGLHLSRFDRLLILNRDRINRIYKGLVPEDAETDVVAEPGDTANATEASVPPTPRFSGLPQRRRVK
jgi:phenylpropionate dioxygenase-like ring-hydroxylating dioxygenase large terminal subunit